jgi:hypothetical protein
MAIPNLYKSKFLKYGKNYWKEQTPTSTFHPAMNLKIPIHRPCNYNKKTITIASGISLLQRQAGIPLSTDNISNICAKCQLRKLRVFKIKTSFFSKKSTFEKIFSIFSAPDTTFHIDNKSQ